MSQNSILKLVWVVWLILQLSYQSFGQLIKPSLNIGLTSYSYFGENVLGSLVGGNNYFKSFITAPTIGFRLEAKKYHVGIESHYYQASVPTTVPDKAALYGKMYFDAGVYGIYRNFRLSLFYNHINFRNYVYFGFGDLLTLAYEEGVGAGISYTQKDYEIGFRVERLWEVDLDGNIPLETTVEIFTLRLVRNFKLLNPKEDDNRKPKISASKKNLFNLQFGLMVSGNGLHGRVNSMSFLKVAPSLGIEFNYRNFGLYLRRSVWQNIDLYYPEADKYNSLNNQIGLSYDISLPKLNSLTVGMHHLWNYTRGQQYYSIIKAPPYPPVEEVAPFIPQNQGVGIMLSYEVARNLDFVLNTDFYYKSYPELGNGWNAESLRFGLLYNLR